MINRETNNITPPGDLHFRALGIYDDEKKIYWATRAPHEQGNHFSLSVSSNGIDFSVFERSAQVLSPSPKLPTDDIDKCEHFRFSQHGAQYNLSYIVTKGEACSLVLAQSNNLKHWEKVQQIPGLSEPGVFVDNFAFRKQKVFYFGGLALSLAYVSEDGKTWKVRKTPLSRLPKSRFHLLNAWVMRVDHMTEGLLVSRIAQNEDGSFLLFATLLDAVNPAKVLWDQKEPLRTIDNSRGNLKCPIGLALRDDRLISYWQGAHGKPFLLNHLFSAKSVAHKNSKDRAATIDTYPKLSRPKQNPILGPLREHAWESKAAFNPAALHEGGEIYLVYRAIGDDDVSVLGYATTEKNGITIKKRLTYPIYVPRETFEGAPGPNMKYGRRRSVPSPFASGGGWNGGCEDPKLTRVEDKIYLTYVAYDGWSPPKLALSSIGVQDFLKGRWGKWRRPVIISKPGCVDKSGAILPEKINGKFVVFHRVFPNILVDFVDDLEALNGHDRFLEGQHVIPPNEEGWDSGKLSVGAPPIKTKDGWLVIYHSTTGRVEWAGTDCRYKMGAMLLDLENPSKVLFRSNKPILEPEMPYENDGLKYGIVYPCGAVVKEGKLLVYYGGSDEFVCVATTDIDTFLHDLKNTGDAKLELLDPSVSQQE